MEKGTDFFFDSRKVLVAVVIVDAIGLSCFSFDVVWVVGVLLCVCVCVFSFVFFFVLVGFYLLSLVVALCGGGVFFFVFCFGL